MVASSIIYRRQEFADSSQFPYLPLRHMHIPNEKKRATVFILRRWLVRSEYQYHLDIDFKCTTWCLYTRSYMHLVYIRVDTKARHGMRDVG